MIGRSPYCSIAITSDGVSREHAKIVRRGAKATIEDLNSSNGTLVNGKRVTGTHPLMPGDKIEIGDETLEVTRDPKDPRGGENKTEIRR